MSRLEAGPVFVVEVLLEDGRWSPGTVWDSEGAAWDYMEGAPDPPQRLVRVDSWRGRVVAVSDAEGLVEPVGIT